MTEAFLGYPASINSISAIPVVRTRPSMPFGVRGVALLSHPQIASPFPSGIREKRLSDERDEIGLENQKKFPAFLQASAKSTGPTSPPRLRTLPQPVTLNHPNQLGINCTSTDTLTEMLNLPTQVRSFCEPEGLGTGKKFFLNRPESSDHHKQTDQRGTGVSGHTFLANSNSPEYFNYMPQVNPNDKFFSGRSLTKVPSSASTSTTTTSSEQRPPSLEGSSKRSTRLVNNSSGNVNWSDQKLDLLQNDYLSLLHEQPVQLNSSKQRTNGAIPELAFPFPLNSVPVVPPQRVESFRDQKDVFHVNHNSKFNSDSLPFSHSLPNQSYSIAQTTSTVRSQTTLQPTDKFTKPLKAKSKQATPEETRHSLRTRKTINFNELEEESDSSSTQPESDEDEANEDGGEDEEDEEIDIEFTPIVHTAPKFRLSSGGNRGAGAGKFSNDDGTCRMERKLYYLVLMSRKMKQLYK